MELGIYTFGELTDPDLTASSSGWPTCSRRSSSPTRSGSTSSAWGSTTGPSSRSPRPRSCSPRPPRAPSASGSRAPSRDLARDDPVRVFQDFATLDLISGGRAEIMAGRGSFIESFPLFGYDLRRLQRAVRRAPRPAAAASARSERVTWRGRTPRADRRPRRLPAPGPGPAAGVDRRRRHARVGRPRGRARPADGARDHRRPARALRALRRAVPRRRATRPGTTRSRRSSINSHGFIADTLEQARRRGLPGPQGRDGQDRPRARLAADDPRAVRGRRDPARRQRHRLSPSR